MPVIDPKQVGQEVVHGQHEHGATAEQHQQPHTLAANDEHTMSKGTSKEAGPSSPSFAGYTARRAADRPAGAHASASSKLEPETGPKGVFKLINTWWGQRRSATVPTGADPEPTPLPHHLFAFDAPSLVPADGSPAALPAHAAKDRHCPGTDRQPDSATAAPAVVQQAEAAATGIAAIAVPRNSTDDDSVWDAAEGPILPVTQLAFGFDDPMLLFTQEDVTLQLPAIMSEDGTHQRPATQQPQAELLQPRQDAQAQALPPTRPCSPPAMQQAAAAFEQQPNDLLHSPAAVVRMKSMDRTDVSPVDEWPGTKSPLPMSPQAQSAQQSSALNTSPTMVTCQADEPGTLITALEAPSDSPPSVHKPRPTLLRARKRPTVPLSMQATDRLLLQCKLQTSAVLCQGDAEEIGGLETDALQTLNHGRVPSGLVAAAATESFQTAHASLARTHSASTLVSQAKSRFRGAGLDGQQHQVLHARDPGRPGGKTLVPFTEAAAAGLEGVNADMKWSTKRGAPQQKQQPDVVADKDAVASEEATPGCLTELLQEALEPQGDTEQALGDMSNMAPPTGIDGPPQQLPCTRSIVENAFQRGFARRAQQMSAVPRAPGGLSQGPMQGPLQMPLAPVVQADALVGQRRTGSDSVQQPAGAAAMQGQASDGNMIAAVRISGGMQRALVQQLRAPSRDSMGSEQGDVLAEQPCDMLPTAEQDAVETAQHAWLPRAVSPTAEHQDADHEPASPHRLLRDTTESVERGIGIGGESGEPVLGSLPSTIVQDGSQQQQLQVRLDASVTLLGPTPESQQVSLGGTLPSLLDGQVQEGPSEGPCTGALPLKHNGPGGTPPLLLDGDTQQGPCHEPCMEPLMQQAGNLLPSATAMEVDGVGKQSANVCPTAEVVSGNAVAMELDDCGAKNVTTPAKAAVAEALATVERMVLTLSTSPESSCNVRRTREQHDDAAAAAGQATGWEAEAPQPVALFAEQHADAAVPECEAGRECDELQPAAVFVEGAEGVCGDTLVTHLTDVQPTGSSVQPSANSIQPTGSSIQPSANSVQPMGSSIQCAQQLTGSQSRAGLATQEQSPDTCGQAQDDPAQLAMPAAGAAAGAAGPACVPTLQQPQMADTDHEQPAADQMPLWSAAGLEAVDNVDSLPRAVDHVKPQPNAVANVDSLPRAVHTATHESQPEAAPQKQPLPFDLASSHVPQPITQQPLVGSQPCFDLTQPLGLLAGPAQWSQMTSPGSVYPKHCRHAPSQPPAPNTHGQVHAAAMEAAALLAAAFSSQPSFSVGCEGQPGAGRQEEQQPAGRRAAQQETAHKGAGASAEQHTCPVAMTTGSPPSVKRAREDAAVVAVQRQQKRRCDAHGGVEVSTAYASTHRVVSAPPQDTAAAPLSVKVADGTAGSWQVPQQAAGAHGSNFRSGRVSCEAHELSRFAQEAAAWAQGSRRRSAVSNPYAAGQPGVADRLAACDKVPQEWSHRDIEGAGQRLPGPATQYEMLLMGSQLEEMYDHGGWLSVQPCADSSLVAGHAPAGEVRHIHSRNANMGASIVAHVSAQHPTAPEFVLASTQDVVDMETAGMLQLDTVQPLLGSAGRAQLNMVQQVSHVMVVQVDGMQAEQHVTADPEPEQTKHVCLRGTAADAPKQAALPHGRKARHGAPDRHADVVAESALQKTQRLINARLEQQHKALNSASPQELCTLIMGGSANLASKWSASAPGLVVGNTPTMAPDTVYR